MTTDKYEHCSCNFHKRIVDCVEHGYSASDGCIIGPKGKVKLALHGKQRYPTFSLNFKGKVYGVPAHKFAAYIYYGNKVFDDGIVVRHLDGNTLNIHKENIALGTHSQNNLDKTEEVRVAAAKKARAAQGYTPSNAKLNADQVRIVRNYYEALAGKKARNGATASLAKSLGVSKTILFNIKWNEYYTNV